MTVQSDLLIEIEAFLAARRSMAETTFGKLAVNDGKFVRRLRDGCNMTLATIDRVRKFIADQQRAAAPPSPANDTPKPKAKRPTRSAGATAPPTSSSAVNKAA
jgi:topoisomerase IA-like protein